jgi:hypothetical protein
MKLLGQHQDGKKLNMYKDTKNINIEFKHG